MKKIGVRIGILFGIFLFWNLDTQEVYGNTVWNEKGILYTEEEREEDYLRELYRELDFKEVDGVLERELPESISFSELVQKLLFGGFGDADWKNSIFKWMKEQLTGEWTMVRKLFTEVLLLAVCFSVLKNFSGTFAASYITELCFLCVYCVMVVLLLQAFYIFQEIAGKTLKNGIEFMQAFVPTLCISMLFASNVGTAMGFYEAAYLVIYLIECIFYQILMPLIHIYVLLEIFGHFMPEDSFSNLRELFYGIISGGMKVAGAAVLGLNVVQNLITPAKDRIAQGALAKTASALPVVGNAVNSVTELVLGTGIVIKNCIGAAGLVALLLVCLVPLGKVLCLTFFYKIAAAVTEPVTDRRISGCLAGMAKGGMLYLRLMGYAMLLFGVTIAVTVAASGFMH